MLLQTDTHPNVDMLVSLQVKEAWNIKLGWENHQVATLQKWFLTFCDDSLITVAEKCHIFLRALFLCIIHVPFRAHYSMFCKLTLKRDIISCITQQLKCPPRSYSLCAPETNIVFRLREEGYQTLDPRGTAEINQEEGVRVEFMWARWWHIGRQRFLCKLLPFPSRPRVNELSPEGESDGGWVTGAPDGCEHRGNKTSWFKCQKTKLCVFFSWMMQPFCHHFSN